jgi:hypothetical protein
MPTKSQILRKDQVLSGLIETRQNILAEAVNLSDEQQKHKKDSLQELLTNARESQGQLLAFLNTIPPENFNKDFGVRVRGYKVTIHRLLEAEQKDEQIHLRQITSFFEEAK